MKTYKIMTDHFEFRFRGEIPAMSAAEIVSTHLSCDDSITANSIDPTTAAEFSGEAEALGAWAAFETFGSTRRQRGGALNLLTGEIAWLEAQDVDEDGFVLDSEILRSAAAAYAPEEEEE